MTDEDRIIALMNQQARLKKQIDALDRDASELPGLIQQHRKIVNELIILIDGPLRAAFEKSRRQTDQAGIQYTDMVHDFFQKLLERKVNSSGSMTSFDELRRLVAAVVFNQIRDYFRVENRREEILRDSVARIAMDRQKYWNERYATEYQDAMLELSDWQDSEDIDRRRIAEAFNLHYIAGLKWGETAKLLSIERWQLDELRKKAAKFFNQR